MKRHAVFVLACMLASAPAGAAIFAVTTTNDGAEAAATVGDGSCNVGGQCTLRAALQEANVASDADTITVPAGIYTLSVPDPVPGDGFPDLDVTNPVTITGAGPTATIIDANLGGGVFEVQASATITGLTIRNGKEAAGDGGGIYAYSDTPFTLVVRDAQIVGNRALHGGGVFVDGSAAVTLERVSITGNTGTTSGGAAEIGTDVGGGTLTIRNATISGNVSGLHGVLNEGTLTLDHVTFVGDTLEGAGSTTVKGSILDAGPSGTVCVGAVVSQGGNLEHGASCGFAMAGDASGVDPGLGPLQDNGGGTLTHALTATSPAVDAGACALTEDQRGTHRPLDGDGDGSAVCDAGAYELDPFEGSTTSTTTTTITGPTVTTTTLAGSCPSETTFASVRCRIDALATRVTAAGTGSFVTRLVASLGKAKARVSTAETAAATSAKKGKKLLKKAGALVKQARAKIGSKKGQKTFTDATARSALQSDADAIRTAITALAGTLG